MATTTTNRGLVDIIKENRRNILNLAQQSTKPNFNPEDPKWKPYIEGLDAVLSHMEQNPTMTPELKQESQIHKYLEVICLDARFHFPQRYIERATALHNQFEAENWGGLAEIKDETEEEAAMDDIPRRGNRSPVKSTSKGSTGGTIIQPPIDHPIWGKNGIMHGIALRRSAAGGLTKIINPAFIDEKRDFRVRGHNGIDVGQWYPNRLAAIFAGVHGAMQAGISGNGVEGAWSVVVSGMYEGLDTDSGDTVLYSGSGSHDNEDKNAPADSTGGTRALKASLQSRNVVRLLRSSAASLAYAPIEGLRYDGLYRVVGMDLPRNARGGLYERFKLVREPGQPALSECKKRPTPQELRDYNKINAGYSGYGMK